MFPPSSRGSPSILVEIGDLHIVDADVILRYPRDFCVGITCAVALFDDDEVPRHSAGAAAENHLHKPVGISVADLPELGCGCEWIVGSGALAHDFRTAGFHPLKGGIIGAGERVGQVEGIITDGFIDIGISSPITEDDFTITVPVEIPLEYSAPLRFYSPFVDYPERISTAGADRAARRLRGTVGGLKARRRRDEAFESDLRIISDGSLDVVVII